MTAQSAAGSGVCPLQEPEGEIVLEIRTVPQASPLSLSADVSLDPLVVEDPPAFGEPCSPISGNILRLAERLAAVGRTRPLTLQVVVEIVLTERLLKE